jgi:hypothetical protein
MNTRSRRLGKGVRQFCKTLYVDKPLGFLKTRGFEWKFNLYKTLVRHDNS